MTTSQNCLADKWPEYKSICLSLDAKPEAVRGALGRVTNWMNGRALAHETAELVLAEILNNLVEHATNPKAPVITLRLREDPDFIYCEILDQGVSFSPMSVKKSAQSYHNVLIDDLPEGGFGLFLVQTLAESISYESENGQNRLSLRLPLTTMSEQI